MSGLSKATKAAWTALALATLAPQGAGAVELIPKLDCALTQTTRVNGQYCLTIFNTCDSSIASRIQESGASRKTARS